MTEYEGHTPGPWTALWDTEAEAPYVKAMARASVVAREMTQEDAELIAAAPTLLAERDEARAQLYTARAATEVLSVGFNAACAQRDALAEALGALIDDTCSYICPSTGREGVPIPHSPRCIAARAALEKARGT